MAKTSSLLSKTLVVGVIVLFIGVGVQPAFARAEHKIIEYEYYDVTTEFIRLGKEHTVKLTKEEAYEVDQIFDSIRIQLNKSNSREEVNEIFKEAIVNLDKFGILGGISIKQAQRLVVFNKLNQIKYNILNKFDNGFLRFSNDNDNMFCQIYGRVDNCLYFNYWLAMNKIKWAKENGYLWIPAFWPFLLGFNLGIIPIKTASMISIGATRENDFSQNEYHPSKGEIWTNGKLGVKEWHGKLKGMFYDLTYAHDFASFSMVAHIGIKLFRGISIKSFINTKFFGFAREVKIEYWNP